MTVIETQGDWNERANRVMPAGGNGNYDPSIVIREGHGSRVWTEDGREFVDYLIGSGPMVLGHAHPEVVEAVSEQLGKGSTFFAGNARGVELAEEISRAMPCAERVRYVSTGTEADMFALRAARAFTGRDKIVKFEGGFHGVSPDAMMSLAPRSLVNFPVAVPDSAGIPDGVRDNMLIAPFNDIGFVRGLLSEYSGEIAAVIVEPLQRLIPPAPGFLEELRVETQKHGIVLIFDEIVTGFRLAYGGAQEKYGVIPDICTVGKIVGGGFPLAAIAGKADIMAHFDKAKVGDAGFLYASGTLSGNPVAAVAGLKTLEILRRPGTYDKLRANGGAVRTALGQQLTKAGIPHQVVGDPVLFDVVFTAKPVANYRDTFHADITRLRRFNALMRERGILKAENKIYPSVSLTAADIEQTVTAITETAALLAE